jgi:hypothetical protein
MGNLKVGQKVVFRGEEVEILEKIKGSKTKQMVYQNGICPVGYKSKPPSYILSNGMRVKGNTLKNK